MVPAGSSFVLDVQGQVRIGFVPVTPEDVRSNVADLAAGYLYVDSLTLSPVGDVYLGILDWSYGAEIRIRTRYSHASTDDVKSIVAGAFQQATDGRPTVTIRGVDPAQANGLPNNGGGLDGLIGKLLGGLQSSVFIVAIAVIVGGVLVLKAEK